MARGKFVTKHERNLIRAGVERGLNGAQIAVVLNRTKQSVYQTIRKMKESGEWDQIQGPILHEEFAAKRSD